MGSSNSKRRQSEGSGDAGKLPRTLSIEPRDSVSSGSTAYVRADAVSSAASVASGSAGVGRNSISEANSSTPATGLGSALQRPVAASQGLSPLATSVGSVGGIPAASITSPGAEGTSALGGAISPGPAGARSNEINLDEVVQRLLNVRNTKAAKTLVVKNSEIMWICHRAREIFLDQPVLLELNPHPSLTICGDIHGRGFLLQSRFQPRHA
jgi:hypothetical protein